MKIKRLWGKHFLGAEATLVIGLTLMAAVCIRAFDGASRVDSIMANNRASVYRSIAAIAGSLLGFSITATSIIVRLSSRKSLTILSESEDYPTLWKTLFQTAYFLGGLTVVSLISLVFGKEEAPIHWFFIFTLMLTGLSVVRVWRTLWIFQGIVRIITASDRHRNSKSRK